jgi:hypothetical protein
MALTPSQAFSQEFINFLFLLKILVSKAISRHAKCLSPKAAFPSEKAACLAKAAQVED